ncbi:MAG: isocitrate/isopropylmalate dehydrogenase family protein [Anaerolineales bacterium]|nr:isocitrate/isopropylmalate dehydrogenase family protein [Anaerolineales bacterium]
MPKYRIAWMPGDGIGVDVMDAARLILDELNLDAEYPHSDIGWEFWCKEGNPLPTRTIDLLKTCTCGLFGAITSKPKDEAALELAPELQNKGLSYRSPIVGLRQLFDLYTNLRPCKAYKGNPLNYKDDIDLVIFRENTEGLYSGVEFHPLPDEVRELITEHNPRMSRFDDVPSDEMAVSLRVITNKGARRIIRQAFAYAQNFNYPTVTLVEKPNVLRETSGLMRHIAREVSNEYPDIELWETNIDAQMMWLLKNPEDYGVIVTSNMFGDIVSDLSAQLVGGLGFAASGNIGDEFAVFEPTHGSAPKYAGQYKVNPTAMLLATKLMLDWLGESEMAERLEKAIAGVIADGKISTYDMGGSNTTLEMAEAVKERL